MSCIMRSWVIAVGDDGRAGFGRSMHARSREKGVGESGAYGSHLAAHLAFRSLGTDIDKGHSCFSNDIHFVFS